MCGRFTLSNPTPVAALVGMRSPPDLFPRYNVAPSQQVAAVRQHDGTRELSMLRWGLIPSWAKDPKIAFQCINARAETVAEKPAYRSAFKARRCLIPADGFYEWRAEGKKKFPVHFRLKSAEPFCFAGLWEAWTDPQGEVIESCTLITTTPNELVAPIHDRMPVILHRDAYGQWLDDRSRDGLLSLLHPYPADQMVAADANPVVNSPKHDAPNCLPA